MLIQFRKQRLNIKNACRVIDLLFVSERILVAGCRLQVAGCRLQVAGCRLQVEE
jgi:hypothetical protein